jgi:hypothetical protein
MDDEDRVFDADEIEMVVEGEDDPPPLPITHADFEFGSDDELDDADTDIEARHPWDELSYTFEFELMGDGGDPSEMDTDELLEELTSHKDSRLHAGSHEGPPMEDGEEGEVYVDSTTGKVFVYKDDGWIEHDYERGTDGELHPCPPFDEDVVEAGSSMGTEFDRLEEFSVKTEVGTPTDELSDPDFTPGEGSVASAFRKLANFERDMARDETFHSSFKHRDHPRDVHGPVSMDGTSEDSAEYSTYEIEVDVEMTKQLLERIGDEVEKRERQGYTIDQLVLGLPQYKVLEVWAQENYGQDAEAVIPVDDVIVVPGPMIHPVIDNRRMMSEYMAEEAKELHD